ncbi:serine/threonine-protein kinase [Streptomyces sp. NPDC001922]|uniref:serine/threonine-protein kinase n=1 Tax=Streptomyces sp. NPDC001922 TaxID=3364624 RepID=UPI0036CB6F3E
MGSYGGGEGGRLLAGRYRLGARLGRGGMGVVWRATDQLLGRQVAVKELYRDDGLPESEARLRRERTLREARTVAQLQHPHVIVVHDVVEQDERPWIVMELVDGRSLSDQLSADGPVPPREAARIALALLGALRAAHAHGVLHRDVKPANVLMERGSGRVVLTDFGIAQVSGGTTITERGSFVGSPEYTAPERMSGSRTGPESDLWSLGVLLCAALSGRSLFHRDSLGGVLHAVVSDVIRPPDAAAPLMPVVRGLLERDPDRRLDAATAESLLAEYLRTGRMPEQSPSVSRAWRGAVEPPGDTAATVSGPVGGPPGSGATRARTAVAAALLVAAALGAGVAAVAMLVDEAPGGGTGVGPSATWSRDGGKGGPGGRPSASGRSPSPAVTVTSTATETTGPTGTGAPGTPGPSGSSTAAPKGYRTVFDPEGFRMAVPTGFIRSLDPPRVLYSSPGAVLRLGVRIGKTGAGSPLAALRRANGKGPEHYRGYREARVDGASFRGRPAARREFTWDGAAGSGPRCTYDLTWDEGGRRYEVSMTAPVAERARARRHFDTALDTFHRTGS